MATFSEDTYLVRRVRVALSSIIFHDMVESRLFNESKVKKLREIFAIKCENEKLDYHVSALTIPIELDTILQTSGLNLQ
jgi:hypothetical protein